MGEQGVIMTEMNKYVLEIAQGFDLENDKKESFRWIWSFKVYVKG